MIDGPGDDPADAPADTFARHAEALGITRDEAKTRVLRAIYTPGQLRPRTVAEALRTLNDYNQADTFRIDEIPPGR